MLRPGVRWSRGGIWYMEFGLVNSPDPNSSASSRACLSLLSISLTAGGGVVSPRSGTLRRGALTNGVCPPAAWSPGSGATRSVFQIFGRCSALNCGSTEVVDASAALDGTAFAAETCGRRCAAFLTQVMRQSMPASTRFRMTDRASKGRMAFIGILRRKDAHVCRRRNGADAQRP